MSFYFLFPLVSMMVNSFVWVYILAQRKPDRVNLAYLIASANISVWLVIETLTWLPVPPGIIIPLAHAASVFWLGLGFWFLCFVYAFTGRRRDVWLYAAGILYAAAVVTAVSTNLIKGGIHTYAYWGASTRNGFLYEPAVLAVIYIPFAYALALLARKRSRTADPAISRQMTLVIIGTTCSLSLALLTNVILPRVPGWHDMLPLAGTASVIHNVFLFIAVHKYNLLQLTVEKAAPDIFASMNEGIIIIDLDGDVMEMNPSARRLLGVSENREVIALLKTGTAAGRDGETELTVTQPDGPRIVSFTSSSLMQGGRPLGTLYLLRDVTAGKEALRLEEQVFHLQKMESVGRLAGGVAHDFNNMLGVISGFAEMIQYKHGGNKDLDHYTETIINTCRRAGELTGKLLAFARKGAYSMKIVDLHDVIRESISILEHTLDKRVRIGSRLNAPESIVRCDTGQIQNAILNMAINAQDAMPDGGDLTLGTAITEITERERRSRPYAVAAGMYVTLTVADTGSGMDQETLSHVFEPFFTTKSTGKGTGLGLASVYGTVKGHAGFIEVDSIPGRGSVFRISLPLCAADTKTERPAAADATGPRSGGTVMIVDDEEYVREVLGEMLTFLGYRVIACTGCRKALAALGREPGGIDLVILDVMMPECDGLETFRKLKTIDPDIRVVIASGYSQDGRAATMLDEGALTFMSKPFSLKKLRSVLDEFLV